MARAGGDGGASFGIGRIVGYASGGYQAVDDDEEEMRGWGREPVGKGHDGWSRRRSGLGGFLGGLSDRIGEWVEQVDSGGLMREYVMETAGRAVTQCGPGTDRKMPPQILRMVGSLAPLPLFRTPLGSGWPIYSFSPRCQSFPATTKTFPRVSKTHSQGASPSKPGEFRLEWCMYYHLTLPDAQRRSSCWHCSCWL
jgi:hypothetical protein